jgi:hypothetical protein
MTLLALAVTLLFIILGVTKFLERKKKVILRSQAGVTSIQGEAGNSLAKEKMRISPANRAKGLEGELAVATDLERLATEYGLTVLHDLSMPGTTANIDHILITSKVVYVIDAKNYKGLVKIVANKQGVKRLRISGRDETKLAEKLKNYSDKVSEILKSAGIQVKVLPLLAFYNASFHNETALSINGVVINVFGIENELLRYANLKAKQIDIAEVTEVLLENFPRKAV